MVERGAVLNPALIGYVAAIWSTLTFLPQAIRCWQTRQTRDISLATYVLLCGGNIVWIVYGFMRGDAPVILTNTLVCLTGLSIVWLKLTEKPLAEEVEASATVVAAEAS